MILDTTLKTIEIVLAGAKTTNDCEYTVDYADTNSGTSFVPAGSMGVTNGTTAVTVVPAPSGVQRHVKALTVYNADTVNSTVTVRMYDGTNRRIIRKVTLTPGQTLVFSPEAGWSIPGTSAGQIPGTTTNDNAAAGCVGEYISSTVLQGASVSAVTGVAMNVTNITLTPGDWDVFGNIITDAAAGAILTAVFGWGSSVSATFPTPPNNGSLFLLEYTSAAGNNQGGSIGTQRVSVATNTPFYLGGNFVFSGGTLKVYGFIGARRAR